MSAVYVSNLIINTGATFSQSFDLLNAEGSGPLDLTGFTAEAQFRKHPGSSSKTDLIEGSVLVREGVTK